MSKERECCRRCRECSFPIPQGAGRNGLCWSCAGVSKPESRESKIIDALLAHCPNAECSECAKIICPYGEPLHFHHDGCPACAILGVNEDDKNDIPETRRILHRILARMGAEPDSDARMVDLTDAIFERTGKVHWSSLG